MNQQLWLLIGNTYASITEVGNNFWMRSVSIVKRGSVDLQSVAEPSQKQEESEARRLISLAGEGHD